MQIKEEDRYFYGSISVPPVLIRFIIGRKGKTIKSIQKDTETIVIIPKPKSNERVTVKGNSHASVERALEKIVSLITHGRNFVALTHFFSIETNNKELRSNFALFKAKVLQVGPGDRADGISDNLFQKPHKLHLTLSTLVLCDRAEVDIVVERFNKFQSENAIFFERPLCLHLRGVGYWGNDAARARVVFGKVNTLIYFHE